MSALKGYLLSIVAVAVLCAASKRILPQTGTVAATGKLIVGLILTLTVLYPLKDLNPEYISQWKDAYLYDAQQIVQSGTQISKDALSDSIKKRTEAYILDKAAAYNAQIAVEIVLTDETIPCPCEVKITGNISPYAKNALQNMISHDLGIDKEHQTWNQSN